MHCVQYRLKKVGGMAAKIKQHRTQYTNNKQCIEVCEGNLEI